jgi:hypothetical protein
VYYNSRLAYPGLGFDQILWADRFSEPGRESIAIGEQIYLFDGDLFEQNLQKVQALLRDGKPFLNYVLTMCGHAPFDLDPTRHPPLIQVSPRDEELERVTNLTYYRTQALVAYVRRLLELDPRGLIVMVSDHLPPLAGGTLAYQRLGYQGRAGLPDSLERYRPFDNLLLVIADGKVQKLPRMRHFDLPRWILDQLTGGAYCHEKICDFGRLPVNPAVYRDEYRTILGLAARAGESGKEGAP